MIDHKKTIFVTGGAGFIGSNYLNKYVLLNPETLFVNIDALTYAGNLDNVRVSNEDNYFFCKVDIRDKSKIKSLFEEFKPDAIINFAAESHVDLSLKDPNIFIETNILGTNNLLFFSIEYDLKRFHQISTDEVYGSLDKTGESFTEKDLLNPRNPYSASKAGAEMLVNSYHETFGLNTVITRSSNTFGPNQDASKLIPRFIGLLQKGEKVNLYGKGEQIREWLYVEDCISGINAVFENGHNGEIYNVGGGLEMTNYELTLELLKSFDKDETSISYVEDRLGHDFRYSMNTSKIKDELDWSPKVSFEEGLENTISSYEPE